MKIPDWLPAFGDMEYRNKNCPPESAEQITFFNALRRDYPRLGMIAIHPRNEGKRTMQQVQRQKAEGMTTGAPDIVIPGNPSFLCELKRLDHTQSRWQDGQLEYLQAAKENGSFVCVAFGHKAALEALKTWIGN
jgi:hypothetical protein